MKRFLAILLAILALTALAACGSSEDKSATADEAPAPEEKPLTVNGVTITLPADYAADDEIEGDNLVTAISSEDGRVAIYVIRQSRTEAGDAIHTAKDYLTGVHDAAEGEEISAVGERDGLPYFTYEETTETEEDLIGIKYLNVAYVTDGDCWLVQFLCLRQEYDALEESFFRWAKTVTFA